MQDIHLFRFDDLTGEIYILAGKHERMFEKSDQAPQFWRSP